MTKSTCLLPPCWTTHEFLLFLSGVGLSTTVILVFLWLWRERPDVRCRPGHPHGIHGEVIYGLGGMGDASLCLRCGLDTYGRIWPRESIREARGEPDFEIIRAARALGLENK